ncbi:MAG: cache domain-containing protein [Desulfitobacteriaceae bacterium]
MKDSFVNRIILILILFCILPFLFFTFVFVMNTKSFDQNSMKESLTELINSKALLLQKDLALIENETVDIAEWASENPDLKTDAEMESYIREKINRTGTISYTLFIPEAGDTRIYPFEEKAGTLKNIDFRGMEFYKEVKENLKKGFIAEWSRPYYDFITKGWMLTCSSPVFRNGDFAGVISSHVSIKDMSNAFKDTRLGENGVTFILDKKGYVLYHPDMLSMKGYEGEVLGLNFINRSDLPSYNRIIDRMISGMSGIDEFQSKDMQLRMIAFKPIDTKGWEIAVEVNKSHYMASYEHLSIGFWFLIFGLMFAVLLFSSKFSYSVTEPIVELTNDVKRMSEGEFNQVTIRSNDEIGMLGQAYNTMSRRLRSYTESLIYTNKQLETVLNSIVGVMMIIDPDYNINMINLEGENILKRKNIEEIKGKKCYKAFFNYYEPCKGCPVGLLREDGIHHESEVVFNMQVYEISAYPVRNYEYEVDGIVVYSKKITEHIYLEKKLIQSEKMAGIGKMVAGITHELKNPLSVIKGASYLLNKPSVDDEVKSNALVEIENNVRRAEKIVYNMLDFSRTSKDNLQVNIRGLIEQILVLVRQDLVSRRIKVNLEIKNEPVLIYGNSDSFKHIFLNIITNSIEAIENFGEIQIQVKKIIDNRVEITFSDTGKTISKDIVDKIFKPFFTTRNNGTGLGLWIVSNEVERNNGTIQAFGEDSRKFIVILPQVSLKNE